MATRAWPLSGGSATSSPGRPSPTTPQPDPPAPGSRRRSRGARPRRDTLHLIRLSLVPSVARKVDVLRTENTSVTASRRPVSSARNEGKRLSLGDDARKGTHFWPPRELVASCPVRGRVGRASRGSEQPPATLARADAAGRRGTLFKNPLYSRLSAGSAFSRGRPRASGGRCARGLASTRP